MCRWPRFWAVLLLAAPALAQPSLDFQGYVGRLDAVQLGEDWYTLTPATMPSLPLAAATVTVLDCEEDCPDSGQDGCGRLVHHSRPGNGVGAAALRASGLRRSRSGVRAPGAAPRSTRERRPNGPGGEVARRHRGHDPALHAVGRRRDLHQARRRNPWSAGSHRLGKHVGGLGHRPPRLASVPHNSDLPA